MLDFIIKSALKHRLVILALVALVVVWGGATLLKLPIDVFPDLNRPTVTIMTEAGGMAPEEVETLVTLPLESNLNGLPGVQRIRSSSGVGLSVVYVEFDWGTDIFRNRQLVAEKLVIAAEHFPEGIQPVMGPISSIMGQIQTIALSSSNPDVSPMDLRTWAEWTIRPRLLTIPGIAQVISIGGGLKQYQILFSATKVKNYQLVLEDLDEYLGHVGVNTTGGFLDYDQKEFLVRNIGAVKTIEDIENTVIGVHLGRPILIKDVAEVKIGPRLKRGDGSFMGKPAVVMSIQKQPGTDTVALTEQVDKAIAEMRASLPKGVEVNPEIFKQSDFIEVSIAGVKSKLKYGSILVTVILLLFLANLRMTAITLTAIPLSFLVTAIVFKLFDLSVNTMTLGGLAIAVGEVVDDAIVDVENVFRRLKENLTAKKRKPILDIVFEASSEVRNSIVLATVIIGLVFIPLFALEGLEGKLFTPLAIAYVTALGASLVVSLTVTPVLCSFMFKNAEFKEHEETKIVKKLKNLDRRVLDWALDHPKKVLAGAFVMFLGSIALLPFMGKDFLPKFNEGTAMVSVISVPGTSLEESNRIGSQAETLLMKTPEVKFVSRRTGRAELDEHAEGVNVSEIDVSFKEGSTRKRDVILDELRENLESIPNVAVNIGQPISHRLDHLLSGVNAQLAIKIFGTDLAVLRTKAAELKNTIQDIEGLVDLNVEQQALIPQVKIQLLREETLKYGLNVGEVSKMLELAFGGRIVSQVIEDQRVFDVFYRFDDASRGNLELMKKTPFKTMPDGTRVTLEMIADVYESTGPNQVNRENGMRRIVVYGNVAGKDLGSVVESIQKRVTEKVSMPEGYYVSYGGQFEAQQSATRKIVLFSIVSILGIASHLLAIGTYGIDMGAFTTMLYTFRDREKILRIFEEVCGARLLYNYMRPGGVSRDLTPGVLDKIKDFVAYMRPNLDELRELLMDNAIFINRTANIGVVTLDQAISYGFSGPNLRGSGSSYDLRKEHPYCGYEKFDFEVCVGTGEHGTVGDCWDRTNVRVNEMYQSLRIIEQAVPALSAGEYMGKIGKTLKPVGEVYLATECPRGALGYHVVADGTKQPWRVKAKSPCFISISSIDEICRGMMLADVVAYLGSIDIVLGEVDR